MGVTGEGDKEKGETECEDKGDREVKMGVRLRRKDVKVKV